MPDDGIFISYRRQDTGAYSGWLGERLSDRFGASRVFKDVNAIKPGSEFPRTISTALEASNVLIALIGSQWNPIDPATGRGRLFDESDWVRREIEFALGAAKLVVPVLIDGTRMPTRSTIPSSLASLTDRQSITLSHGTFHEDVDRLIRLLEVLRSSDANHRERTSQAGRDRFKELDGLLRRSLVGSGKPERWRKPLEKVAASLDDDDETVSHISLISTATVASSRVVNLVNFLDNLSEDTLIVLTNRRLLLRRRGMFSDVTVVYLADILAVSTKKWLEQIDVMYLTLSGKTLRLMSTESSFTPICELLQHKHSD